jgi:hypothetical protein
MHLGFQLKMFLMTLSRSPVTFGSIAQVCILKKNSHWCFLFDEFLGIVKFWITLLCFSLAMFQFLSKVDILWSWVDSLGYVEDTLWKWAPFTYYYQGICFISNIWIIGVNVCPNTKVFVSSQIYESLV